MTERESHPKYRELGNPPKQRQFEFYCEHCDARFPSQTFVHTANLKNQAVNFGAGLVTKFFGGNKIVNQVTDAVAGDRNQMYADIEKERAAFLVQAEAVAKQSLTFDQTSQKWLCQSCFMTNNSKT